MNSRKVNCTKHGEEELAIACIHVCREIDSGVNVGFFWHAESTNPRPDAWCRECEKWSLAHPDDPIEEWMRVADFQFLCVRCWDDAKTVLYDQYQK
jgi:hypothetical protein